MSGLLYNGHVVGSRVEINGVHYAALPETDGCDGCAGDNDNVLSDRVVCRALPLGCSVAHIIWVKVPLNPAVGTQPSAYTIKPPVSNPTGPHNCPSKEYKPVHGGYPDARPQKGLTD